MKKIIVLTLGFVGLGHLNAQQTKSRSLVPEKSISVQEANRVNGNAVPVMQNGKPYSQWVAEEKSKNKQASTQAVVNRKSGPEILSNTAAAASDLLVNPQTKPGTIPNVPIVDDGPRAGQKTGMPDASTVNEVKEPVVQKPEATFTKTQPAQAPELFKLPTQAEWNGLASKPAAEAKETQDPSAKQSPSNIVIAEERQVPANSAMLMSPVETKEVQPVNKSNDQPAEKKQPQVPEQFRIIPDQKWGDPAPQEASVVKQNIAQQPGKTEPVSYKTKELPNSNIAPDLEKPVTKAAAATVVSNKETKAAPAPEVPSQFRLNTSQSWNGRAVNTEAGTVKTDQAPAEQNKPATEKPAKQN